jgi:hypothetical protein
MCCFAPIVNNASLLERLFFRSQLQVANTNIFARKADASTQLIVYGLQVEAPNDVAMILPLPVAAGAGERAVEFVNLGGHDGFFSTLAELFQPPVAPGGDLAYAAVRSSPTLRVHQVGAYEASFVPTWHAFERLDARFRMPPSVWRKIGGYEDYGFAVFQLAPSGKVDVHPMAFRFATRVPERLFFPTVHVHDGRVHRTARFDHFLYYQGNAVDADERAGRAIPEHAHPLVRRDQYVRRRGLHGKLPNRDTWIALADTE